VEFMVVGAVIVSRNFEAFLVDVVVFVALDGVEAFGMGVLVVVVDVSLTSALVVEAGFC